MLSLFDGIGGAAVALVQKLGIKIDRYISVEKAIHRCICMYAYDPPLLSDFYVVRFAPAGRGS